MTKPINTTLHGFFFSCYVDDLSIHFMRLFYSKLLVVIEFQKSIFNPNTLYCDKVINPTWEGVQILWIGGGGG